MRTSWLSLASCAFVLASCASAGGPAVVGDSPLERFLAALPYRQLQRLSKEHGLRASDPALALAGALAAHYAENGGAPPGFVLPR